MDGAGLGRVPETIRHDRGFVLNIVLFLVPAIFWTVCTKRPWATVAAMVAASLLIEWIQVFAHIGFGDPADLIANTVGAAIGAALGHRWLLHLGGRVPLAQLSRVALFAPLVCVLVALYGGVAWAIVRADQQRSALADELRHEFAGEGFSTIEPYLLDESPGVRDEIHFEMLVERTSLRPDSTLYDRDPRGDRPALRLPILWVVPLRLRHLRSRRFEPGPWRWRRLQLISWELSAVPRRAAPASRRSRHHER